MVSNKIKTSPSLGKKLKERSYRTCSTVFKLTSVGGLPLIFSRVHSVKLLLSLSNSFVEEKNPNLKEGENKQRDGVESDFDFEYDCDFESLILFS